jgi:signal transduction histidine kinase
VERLVTVLEHTERGGQIAFAIEVPTPMKLAIDPEALAEILGAVLDNATRYARRLVRITAHQDANTISLRIEDDGPGIASERIRDVLARGTRLDESAGGTGLGLAIAHELAGATGGAIALDASQLGGLRVCFNWGIVVE